MPAPVRRNSSAACDGGATWSRCHLGNGAECDFINTPQGHLDPFRPARPGRQSGSPSRSTASSSAATAATPGPSASTASAVRTPTTWSSSTTMRETAAPSSAPRRKACTRAATRDEAGSGSRCRARPGPTSAASPSAQDDSGVMFLSVGDKPSGEQGMLFRSRDQGRELGSLSTCRSRPTRRSGGSRPTRPNPDLIFFCTIFGQIFRSRDGGESWQKMRRELGELRMIAWQPAET